MTLRFKNINECKKDSYSFPAFVPNMKDVLYEFNDTTLDIDYIKSHILGEKAIYFAEKTLEKVNPANRICGISSQIINNMEEYFFTGLLTSDETEDLYSFNFLTFNENNLLNWKERKNFIRIASEFIASDKWKDVGEFGYLKSLISRANISI